ncbi:hypothetical protein HPB47_012360 [Ixodes persulcatus]|uniref:Uncharacterized protein n=1 Tax=Ixodes persulcatus TaxID=34615 RepID=A0AC60NTR5_IXOPE|nr:hypothetical protein HPB47_012360 [Ixodes persulcatus]
MFYVAKQVRSPKDSSGKEPPRVRTALLRFRLRGRNGAPTPQRRSPNRDSETEEAPPKLLPGSSLCAASRVLFRAAAPLRVAGRKEETRSERRELVVRAAWKTRPAKHEWPRRRATNGP